MKIPVTHLGGATCVTGSCHLLQMQGANILVDCGIAQGRDLLLPMERWPVKVTELDFIFLTHAHLDHIGLLPILVKNGFSGEIICTHPTRALLVPMLKDAMRFRDFSQKDKDFVQKRIEALTWGFEYGQLFHLKKGISFELGCAGHILGSCFVRFDNHKEGYTMLFSGDLENRDTPLLPDPDPAESADFLFLESTYGNRLHENRSQRIVRLASVLDHCLSDGGRVMIPAFALGRTQELLFELDRIFSDNQYAEQFPNLRPSVRPPIFIDTPLGLEVTEIYSNLSVFWDQEAKRLLGKGDHPLDFRRLFTVEKHHQHEQLMAIKGPAVIIAGSGMCSGGRIIDHLAAGIEDPRNDIVFVGYQANGTTGRWICEHAARQGLVALGGRKYRIRAGVHVMGGYSAHADQIGLLDWVAGMAEKPKWIKLVHGADDARKALADQLFRKGFNVE